MKQQVIFVHGGAAYDQYDDFIADLKSFTVDPFVEKKKWRMTLKDDLGPEFEVLLPEMPNKLNAKYDEWKIWMDKHLPFLRDGVIFVGHSLGGIFLVKYLCEVRPAVSVRALYLVAAPFFDLDSQEGGDFRLDAEKVGTLSTKVQKMAFFHAKDDTVVQFSHALLYHTAFPDARFVSFEEGGHFIGESFPELVADIKGLIS